jgi:hypothetical protein
MEQNKKGRLVSIDVLRRYLAGQPEQRHTMVADMETGEVLEVTQTGNEPPTVVQKAPEE